MPWVLNLGASVEHYAAGEINWCTGTCRLDIFDDNFIEAMKMFAQSKQCNGITISEYHKNIWFKRIPDDVDPTEDSNDHSWRLHGNIWNHHQCMDFCGNDEHWIVWGNHNRDKLSFSHWDPDFIEAMQMFADRTAYNAITINEQAVSFFSLHDFHGIRFDQPQSTTWMKREPCHGSHGLLTPMEQCIEEVRQELVKETNKDPLPQFTSQQIADINDFLGDALAAMQAFVNGFSEGSLTELTDEQLQTRQRKAREASRRLGLLLGDTLHEFAGMSFRFAITHSQQANETREQLTTLQSIFHIFGQKQWLGAHLVNTEFVVNHATAIEMLGGLLEPSKVSLANMMPAENLLQSVLDVLAQNINTQVGSLQDMSSTLVQVTQELSVSFRSMQDQLISMQRELNLKMETLQCFAEKLMMFPGVLNKYLLFRLGEIDDSQDLSILKRWISRQEATEVHQCLEAFRDNATEERAVRRMAAGGNEHSSKSPSVASSREFHIVTHENGC